MVILANKDNNTNILHWLSTKCKRVTRSVLASELYVISHGFDISASLKSIIENILGFILNLSTLLLIICTDSKLVYDCFVKLGTIQEKRLIIDLIYLRESYEQKEVAKIKWIDSNSNLANAITKSKTCFILQDLIDINKISIKVT
jgi:hypothetical protein